MYLGIAQLNLPEWEMKLSWCKPFSDRMCNKCIQFSSFAHFLAARPQRNAHRIHFCCFVYSTQYFVTSKSCQQLNFCVFGLSFLVVDVIPCTNQISTEALTIHFFYKRSKCAFKSAPVTRKGSIMQINYCAKSLYSQAHCWRTEPNTWKSTSHDTRAHIHTLARQCVQRIKLFNLISISMRKKSNHKSCNNATSQTVKKSDGWTVFQLFVSVEKSMRAFRLGII